MIHSFKAVDKNSKKKSENNTGKIIKSRFNKNILTKIPQKLYENPQET